MGLRSEKITINFVFQIYLVSLYGNKTTRRLNKFEIIFLKEAREFLIDLDQKSRDKIIFNIDKAKIKNNKELFKKLKDDIWEFRCLYNKTYFRIFAFWDKEDNQETLVLATHGIIKKTDKIPEKEIEKAKQIRINYFDLKHEK
jgi:phage-related protein